MANKIDLSGAASRFAGENPLTVAVVVGIAVAIAAGEVGLPILMGVTAAVLGAKAMYAGMSHMPSAGDIKTAMHNLRKVNKTEIVDNVPVVDNPSIKR